MDNIRHLITYREEYLIAQIEVLEKLNNHLLNIIDERDDRISELMDEKLESQKVVPFKIDIKV